MRVSVYTSSDTRTPKKRAFFWHYAPRRTALLAIVLATLFAPCPVEAKPPEVSFEGIQLPVDSTSSLGSGSVAVRLGDEEFVTTESQAGRSVAIRLIQGSNRSELVESLIPSIVTAALKTEDSRLLEAVIDSEFADAARPQNEFDVIWRQLMVSMVGRRLVIEGVRRLDGQYAPALCRVALLAPEFGEKLQLGQVASAQCLRREVEQIVKELAAGHLAISLVKRARDVLNVFRDADIESVESAAAIERGLRQASEGATLPEYLDTRERLSERLLTVGGARHVRGALGALDDAFLKSLSESVGNAQAITFISQMNFERRSQGTHEQVLRLLTAVRSEEYWTLQQRDTLVSLSRFSEHDSEIASALGDLMGRVISEASARRSPQMVREIVIGLRGAGDTVSRFIEPAVISSIGDLRKQGDFRSAGELEDVWGRPIPVFARCAWFLGENQLAIGGLGMLMLFGLVWRAFKKSRDTLSSEHTDTSPSVPTDYEKALRQVGLAPGVSLTEIKAAYRKAIKLQHPDRTPHATAEDQERFRQTLESFERAIKLHQHILGGPETGALFGTRK